ncbi:MAG: MFS transporter [Phycisphaeraceae bacterium]|nr:MFS transporter [Phycisphaeraceae bacterium]
MTNLTEKAIPRRFWLIVLHITAVVCLMATWNTVAALLPILARKRFGAGDLSTLVITAAPTVFFTLSIFWNDLFSRKRFAPYILIYWALACLPMALVAFADSLWLVLVPHLLCALGGAGYHCAAGELLKRLYPLASRGRIYSIVFGITMVSNAVMGFGVGKWLEADEDSFRLFLPISVVVQLAGAIIFILLARLTAADVGRVRTAPPGQSTFQRVIAPIAHTKDVLKADPVFARYEAAYMTYGVGWMIAYALLPILITDKLDLNYEQATQSTQVAYLLGMVIMLWPAGFLMDRLGAIRSTGISFAALTLYPLGLIYAPGPAQLALVSLVYGFAHAGASVGWMLGPVALAPTPDKVPQYVAIHATFVGIRGKIFQGLGVGLYWLTGSFTLPLAIAALAYAWSAYQMWQLQGRVRRAASPAQAPPPPLAGEQHPAPPRT